ncbi:MAG TPA: M13 family metallopeptidase [Gemmatimonadales bacterium]|nr:M13 family metallopeptidase [Gemmatimonadales bacterium]
MRSLCLISRTIVVAVASASTLPLQLQAQAAAPARSAGIDVAGMDRSVKPGNDFFAFANGTWLEKTEIPADRSSYGAGSMLGDQTDRRVADLIQQAAKSSGPAGSEQRKIGDFYASFMDTVAIEAAGLKPLKATLDSIAAIRDRKALARFLGSTLRADVDAFNATNLYTDNLLGLWVAQDLDDPSQYSPFLLQGGLGMPDRSYYVDTSAAMAEIRDKYQEHVGAMLGLAGVPDGKRKAATITNLETKIARAHWSREESGEISKGNNHWSRAEFGSKAPGLDWETYFAGAGLTKPTRFVVWQPSAVTGIAALTGSEPLDTWKDYLTFHAIQSRVAVLPSALYQQTFSFYGPVLSGAQKPRDRWKRGVSATNASLGYAVGQLYAARYFPAPEKERAQKMVTNLIAAFRERIDRIDWMAPATKREAKAKLAVLKVGVGYPDKWPTYSGLEIIKDDAYGNVERSRLYEYQRAIGKLGRPVDRTEWVMTPQTVNAVNLPAMNAMNFPAAILQPPYFDSDRPLAMDYGAIGAIIGHEVSHSFDDQGALFDSKGRLRNWWTPEDFKHFQESSEKLVAQYNEYRPFPDLAVNGQLTLGENIADVAGLAAAYDAFHRSLDNKPAPVVQGFTGDQQFFISFAQAWRGKAREPALRNQILTDGHSPSRYRATTVRNLDGWYSAFRVKPGEKLYLAEKDRVRVW